MRNTDAFSSFEYRGMLFSLPPPAICGNNRGDNYPDAGGSPITYAGWTGEEYTVIDPTTGAGAYKISGGINGGFLTDDEASFLSLIALAIGLVGAIASMPLVTVAGIIVTLVIVLDQIFDYLAISHRCDGLGWLFLISLAAAVGGLFVKAAEMLLVLFMTALYFGNTPIAVADTTICGEE